MPEQPPKPTRSYPEILQLNQELVRSLQGLSDEDEARKKELEQQRVDQLGAMDAHLNAMRSAVERYLQQGRKAA